MNTGQAPTYRMALTGAINVKVETRTSSSGLHPGHQKCDMQRGRAVHGGHGKLCPRLLCHHLLETVNIGANRRNPCSIEAFLDITPLVATDFRRRQRDEVTGGRRFKSCFSWFHSSIVASFGKQGNCDSGTSQNDYSGFAIDVDPSQGAFPWFSPKENRSKRSSIKIRSMHALSKNISRTSLQNCRSLGFARDDKGKGGASIETLN